jgi:hypothetical protein
MAVRGQRKTILLVFSKQCGACDRNWPNWHSLLDRVGYRANVALINLGTTLPETPLLQLPTQGAVVFARIDAASKQAYGFISTPQTILIRSDGVVEQVWTGALNAYAIGEIAGAVGNGASASLP